MCALDPARSVSAPVPLRACARWPARVGKVPLKKAPPPKLALFAAYVNVFASQLRVCQVIPPLRKSNLSLERPEISWMQTPCA
eukprot:6177513-Pleurochrysis_carterae.AAC.5